MSQVGLALLRNALLRESPFTDIWCHLRSMETAVGHYLENPPKPTPLDRDRLRALADFFDSAEPRRIRSSIRPSVGRLRRTEIDELRFAPHFTLAETLRSTPELLQWRKDWKSGPEMRTNQLADFVRKYAEAANPSLLRTTKSKAELQVVQALVHSLVRQTEEAMRNSLP